MRDQVFRCFYQAAQFDSSFVKNDVSAFPERFFTASAKFVRGGKYKLQKSSCAEFFQLLYQ
jgi:hypothetical protein